MKNRLGNVCASKLLHIWRRALSLTARRTPFSVAILALALLVGLGSLLAPQVYAAGIGVNTTVDEFGTGANCSLREAIQAANTDAAFGGCSAGSGTDTINVPAGTYTLTIPNGGSTNEDANATGDLDVLDS